MIPFESYMKKILEQYPRLDKEEIITGLYTFINSIKIKHPNAIVDVHPSTDTTYQEILFTDANNATLASISFKKYPNANDGIVFKLKDKEFAIKVSDEGHIDLRCDYPLCGFNTGSNEVANTNYVLDAINYNGNLIQTAIIEYLDTSLDSIANAVSVLETKVDNLVSDISLEDNHLLAKNLNQRILSDIPLSLSSIINSTNIYSNAAPTNTVTLFSGNLDNGDIELSQPFTDFDVLFFMFGINDTSTVSKHINLETCRFIPVWLLKNLVNSKSLYGVSANTCCLLDSFTGQYWEINLKNSTSTKLAYSKDNKLRLWRVIGIKYADDTETNE